MSDKINIIFFGTPEYSLVTLKALFEKEDVRVCGVVTKIDTESGRGQKIVPSPVKAFCVENNIPCFQPKSLKKQTTGDSGVLQCMGSQSQTQHSN